ncbi:MAG: hypothetical protein RSC68_35700, partial [Acinetobacter sp.]
MADAVKVIDGAIAAFDATQKPIGYMNRFTGRVLSLDEQPGADTDITVYMPVYAAPQPAPVVPDTLPCPVHLEPGLKFGKGVRTQCMMDALRRRADYYAELEAMTPEQRAEHDAGIAEFKSMLSTNKLDKFKASVVPEELPCGCAENEYQD